MDDFKKDLQKLNVDEFRAGEVTPWDYQGHYDTVQARQLGGFCSGFGGGFCRCGGFCGGRCARCF